MRRIVKLISKTAYEEALIRFGSRRLFSSAEISRYSASAAGMRMASRLAAKSAVRSHFQSLGLVAPSASCIEILNEDSGAPFIKCGARDSRQLEDRGCSFSVSITHTRSVAAAEVVMTYEN